MDGSKSLPSRAGPNRSCTACRKRKIRCDQQRPCGYCKRLRKDCIYTAPDPDTSRSSALDFSSRMDRIETSLQRLESTMGLLVDTLQLREGLVVTDEGNERSQLPASIEQSSTLQEGHLRNEAGETHYASGEFWTRLDDDFEEAATHTAESIIRGSAEPVIFTADGESPVFPLTLSPTSTDALHLHPPLDRILGLWQVFTDSVDPVLKVLHIPTTQQQLLWACQDLASTPASFEALMFSIYYCTVTSMQSTVSLTTLSMSERRTSLNCYRAGLEQNLTRSRFLTTPNVTTLQAFTIYLTCARQVAEKSYVWAMTGLLIRLATKLGLHRDPADLKVSPFESELRRRLWWQIVTLDSRTAEDNDAMPLITDEIHNTKLPLNVNDSELNPRLLKLPSESKDTTSTDMLFTSVRIRIAHATRPIIFSPPSRPALSPAKKNEVLDSLISSLQQTYHSPKFLDLSLPIIYLSKVASHLVLSKLKLTINASSRVEIANKAHEELDSLIQMAVDIIDSAQELRSDTRYARWTWLFEKYVDWDAVAFLLQVMCNMPRTDFTHFTKVWTAIGVFFGYWSRWVPSNEKRWDLLLRLRRKAESKHALSTLNIQDQLSEHSKDREAQNVSPSIDLGLALFPSLHSTQISQNQIDAGKETTSSIHSSDLPQPDPGSIPSGIENDTPELWINSDLSTWTFDDTLYPTPTHGEGDLEMYLEDVT